MKQLIVSLSSLFIVASAGCCDDCPNPSLVGTWDLAFSEFRELVVRCPGEVTRTLDLGAIITSSCGAHTLTFNGDNTYVWLVTADTSGNPFDSKSEGEWWTDGDTLNLVILQGGTSSTQEPVEPPIEVAFVWDLSGTVLTLIPVSPDPDPFVWTLVKR